MPRVFCLTCQRPADQRLAGTGPFAGEQACDALLHDFVPVVENAGAADPGDFGDLIGVQLMPGDEAHDEEAFARPVRLRLLLGQINFLHQFRAKRRKCSHTRKT